MKTLKTPKASVPLTEPCPAETKPATTVWNTENPPKDGQPIVAIGRIISSDELTTRVETFCRIIYWHDFVQSGIAAWAVSDSYFPLVLCPDIDGEVIVDYWLPRP